MTDLELRHLRVRGLDPGTRHPFDVSRELIDELSDSGQRRRLGMNRGERGIDVEHLARRQILSDERFDLLLVRGSQMHRLQALLGRPQVRAGPP